MDGGVVDHSLLPESWQDLLTTFNIEGAPSEIEFSLAGRYPASVSLLRSQGAILIECFAFDLNLVSQAELVFLMPVLLTLNHETLLHNRLYFGLDEYQTLKLFHLISIDELPNIHIQTRLYTMIDKVKEMDCAILKLINGA